MGLHSGSNAVFLVQRLSCIVVLLTQRKVAVMPEQQYGKLLSSEIWAKKASIPIWIVK